MPDPEIADAVVETTEASAPRRRRPLVFLLTAAGILLLGILVFRLCGPQPVLPPKVVAYTPQQAATAQQHIDALGAQLAGPTPDSPPADTIPSLSSVPVPEAHPARPAAPVPTPKPPSVVHFQLSQADLNTYLATDRKVNGLLKARGVQAVQILLQPPHNVVFRAAVLYKGRKTNLQIAGTLLPDPDTLARLEATQAQAGSLPLPPKAVTAQADRIAAQLIGRLRGRLPVTVQTIQVVGDRLVLTGIRHPKTATPVAAGSQRSASPGRR